MDLNWREVDTTHCGIAAACTVVGDRWAMLVVREVLFGVTRFHDIQDHLGVSSAVLSDRLDKLTERGVLRKVRYQDDGRRHRFEYRLTNKGFGLTFVQLAMAEFGYEHLVATDDRLVGLFDAETGQRVRLGLIREDGGVVGLDRLDVRLEEDTQLRSGSD